MQIDRPAGSTRAMEGETSERQVLLPWSQIRLFLLAAAVAVVSATLVSMHAVNRLSRGHSARRGAAIRSVVPLRISRLVGPLLPLVALTWPLVADGSAPAIVLWTVVGWALAEIFAIGLRRSSWIARFEPELLPRGDRPLGYRPSRADDLRLHHLLRIQLVHLVPLAVVLGLTPMTLGAPQLILALFAIHYLAYGFVDHEVCEHWDMHCRVFDPAVGESGRWVPAYRFLLVYVVGAMNGYVPGVYRVSHLSVHHWANAFPKDTHSPLPYRRSSYFEFCIFAMRVTASISLGWDRALHRRAPKRDRAHLVVGVLGTYVVCAALIAGGRMLGFVLLFAILRHGVMVAADQIVWHGLTLIDQVTGAGACSTLWVSSAGYLDRAVAAAEESAGQGPARVPAPGEAWPFFDNLHLVHHLNGRVHFSRYESELARHLPRLREERAPIMAWGRMDEFPFDCWAERYELIGEQLLTVPVDGETRADFVRHHLSSTSANRTAFAEIAQRPRIRKVEQLATRTVCRLTGNASAGRP